MSRPPRPHADTAQVPPSQQWSRSQNSASPGVAAYPGYPGQHYWQQPNAYGSQQQQPNAYGPQQLQQPNAYGPQQQQQQPAFDPAFYRYDQQYPTPNANVYFPPQNYYQPPNQTYAQPPRPGSTQATPSNNPQSDETDPWNWGWEDVGSADAQKSNSNANKPSNDTILNESFSNSDSWNLSWQKEPTPERQQQPAGRPPSLTKRDELESVQLVKSAYAERDVANRSPKKHNWSTESQPSQESSDGILSHTDSTATSDDPTPTSDVNNPQPVAEDSRKIPDDAVNRELVDNMLMLNVNSNSDRTFVNNASSISANRPEQISKTYPSLLPPTFGAASSNGANPFKRVGNVSHRNINNLPISKPPPLPQPLPNESNPNRIVHANLETTPDNSERPDNPSPIAYQTRSYQPTVENCEVTPNNDRNEYLQTGHLSEANFEDSRATPNSMNYPPPNFQRMVLGQPETEYGLSRMVPGHHTSPVSIYNQPPEDYLDRQIDGQTTESDSLTNSACMARPPVYRQVDGQPTDDEINFNQASMDRRPVGSDRMVPGDDGSFNMQIFPNQSFLNTNAERVVTGFEEVPAVVTPREQNVDGSDYSEIDVNQMRSATRSSEQVNSETAPLQAPEPERELNMEGENLQDSAVSNVRDQNMDGADTQQEQPSRTTDILDSESDRIKPLKINEKDRKYRDDTTGDESEKDRMYKLKKDKEASRMRSSRERDIRYNERKEDRREKDKRGGDYHRNERDRVSEDRRYKRNKERYDTEDTDYYSDKERRRYREGSYSSSKPPRPEDRSSRREDESHRPYDRYRDDRDRRRRDDKDKRYDNYDSERDGAISRRREREHDDRDDDRRRYPSDRDRHYGSLRKDRGNRDDRRRGEPRYRPLRSDSRGPEAGEEEYTEGTDRRSRDERDEDKDGRMRRYRRDQRDRGYNDPYYDRYGYSMDPYSQQLYQQHQTYQYYEKLRQTNPQAYLEIYNKYMSSMGQNVAHGDTNRSVTGYGEGYNSLPSYDALTANRLVDERGSVHSGRSSANGEAIKDRMVMMDGSSGYFYPYRRPVDMIATNYVKQTRPCGDQASVRTDYSGSRDFNTDASLNLYLDDSVIKSDRNTPIKFGTAHIKGVISSPNMVIISPSYPSDGQPAMVEIMNINKLLMNDPVCNELMSYPGPLIKGITHKKTVIEFCESKIRAAIDRYGIQMHDRSVLHQHNNSFAEKINVTELGSIVLMWELLILLLRQNGMVVGTDIAELLIKNKHQYAWKGSSQGNKVNSRRDSASSATSRSAEIPSEDMMSQAPLLENQGNHDLDNDSSNDVSLDQSHSLSTNKKDQKHQKDSSSKFSKKHLVNAEFSQTHGNEKYVTDKFREYLLFGSGKDALEWAMTNGLWGHALFLASKLDRRTYANVMTRFANGLSPNDPLQTLYQLMSGKQSAAVTCVLDDKWGDWRPHLAMILSNTSQRPELDKKSITTLGDTLNSRGDLFAAQFCYLMARVEFGKRPGKSETTPVPRLVLLGSSPANENFNLFASNEAIMMTEIYEYACSLADDNFVLPDFQVYKFLLATRLMDYGFYDRTLFYMERIANIVTRFTSTYEATFVMNVLSIAERLKHYDPEDNMSQMNNESEYDANQPFQMTNSSQEQEWIVNLRQISNSLNSNKKTYTPSVSYEAPPQYQQYDQTNWTQQQYQNYDQTQQQTYVQPASDSNDYAGQQQQQQTIENNYETKEQPQLYDPNNTSYYHHNPGAEQHHESLQTSIDANNESLHHYGNTQLQHNNSGYWNQDVNHAGYSEPDLVENKSLPEPSEGGPKDVQELPKPQITMPNSSLRKYDDEDNLNMTTSPKPQQIQQRSQEKQKKEESNNKTQTSSSSGWFGGIFNKLSLKPKNQMILPDDKNPTIVWDPEKKKWTNLEATEEEQENELAPPPKIPLSNLSLNNNNNNSPLHPLPEMGSAPALPMGGGTGNMFKLQKGRHIKKSYVDVFNPSGAPTRPLPPASEILGVTQPTTPPTSYFVPQSMPTDDHSYTSQMAPTFYNPSDYNTGS